MLARRMSRRGAVTSPWDDYMELDGEVGATYDDDGNLIPLSQRFDMGKSDIRFSVADPFYPNAARAVEGVKQNKAKAEQWKAMHDRIDGLNPKVSSHDIHDFVIVIYLRPMVLPVLWLLLNFVRWFYVVFKQRIKQADYIQHIEKEE